MKIKLVAAMILVSGVSAWAESGSELSRYSSRVAVVGRSQMAPGSAVASRIAPEDLSSKIAPWKKASDSMAVTEIDRTVVSAAQYNSRLSAIGQAEATPVFELAPLGKGKECEPGCTKPCCVKR